MWEGIFDFRALSFCKMAHSQFDEQVRKGYHPVLQKLFRRKPTNYLQH